MFAYVPSSGRIFGKYGGNFPVGVPPPRVVLGLKWQVALVTGVQMQVQAQAPPFPLSAFPSSLNQHQRPEAKRGKKLIQNDKRGKPGKSGVFSPSVRLLFRCHVRVVRTVLALSSYVVRPLFALVRTGFALALCS